MYISISHIRLQFAFIIYTSRQTPCPSGANSYLLHNSSPRHRARETIPATATRVNGLLVWRLHSYLLQATSYGADTAIKQNYHKWQATKDLIQGQALKQLFQHAKRMSTHDFKSKPNIHLRMNKFKKQLNTVWASFLYTGWTLFICHLYKETDHYIFINSCATQTSTCNLQRRQCFKLGLQTPLHRPIALAATAHHTATTKIEGDSQPKA